MSDKISSYRTAGGIEISRRDTRLTYRDAIEPLIDALDSRRGVLLASSFEYPGRYTRWDIGFSDPPVEITCRGRDFRITALNERGRVLIPSMAAAVNGLDAVTLTDRGAGGIRGQVAAPPIGFAEEDRSRQPSVFTVIRALVDLFSSPEDGHMGLYGAFGYDLAFQFDPVVFRLERTADQRDLVLFLPDEILLVDHRREAATRVQYDFRIGEADTAGVGEADTAGVGGARTEGMPRGGVAVPFAADPAAQQGCDHRPGQYADLVRKARDEFKQGEMFEVVPGQCFFEPCPAPPSEVFRRLRERNPAPYGALMNLGEREYLVAASPEMFVRVDGSRVETCPISGTVARGKDALEDAANIHTLLNSEKEASELTMCTDVDRNDKSRICEPGSVRIIGRRQIEMYSRLIHTVDHVEGMLRPGYDALDAFLTHCWAVTVTGAPKLHAMQFIEDHEQSPRRWYGGAIGFVGFDGNMNTGLTLRTVRIKDGVAEVRAGATLLYDSDPDAEEAETGLKASAMLNALREADAPVAPAQPARQGSGDGLNILMIDHRDSFVHTLAGYFRETGAEVITLRHLAALERLNDVRPDLVVLSPGPGRPDDFAMRETIDILLGANIPIFGVCLGHQGIAEYFGGELDVLGYPVHGKPARVKVLGGRLLSDLPETFDAGRYHSLFARRETLPDMLAVTAETVDGIVMAVEHRDLPVAGVQFHPESLLSLRDDAGRRLIGNVVERLTRRAGHLAAE